MRDTLWGLLRVYKHIKFGDRSIRQGVESSKARLCEAGKTCLEETLLPMQAS